MLRVTSEKTVSVKLTVKAEGFEIKLLDEVGAGEGEGKGIEKSSYEKMPPYIERNLEESERLALIVGAGKKSVVEIPVEELPERFHVPTSQEG